MSLKQARAELDASRLACTAKMRPATWALASISRTLNDAFTSNVRPALLMLMGCVGFVLLIACSNVANLLLARGSARRREMALRTALGASPLRVIRQVLTESLLLASIGGALGVALAFLVLRGMLAIHPPSVPRIEEVSVDGGVLAYSLLISLARGHPIWNGSSH